MNCSFDQYIKAAVEAGKYDVAAEMAQVIHEGYQLKIDRYPGKDIRVYKDNEGTTKVLCPKEMTYIQESNLTKSIALGTIFEDADTVDNHAKYITLTKFPVKGMKNVGLVDPYKVRECVGSTIGVMNEDGNVDVSDTDIKNGQNVIDDLISKDSTEFNNVKDIVDDYLGNDSHEYGYSIDFTKDIQGLRDEIQRFKDADISAEDSITDDDWNDDWGAASSIMDIEDDETVKGVDTDKVSDDDDESDDDEMTYEEYCAMIEESDTETFVQEGAITSLRKIGYDPKTKTFITDIPDNKGNGSKLRCNIKFGTVISMVNGTCFDRNTNTIHVSLKDLLGDTGKLVGILKHEEGHYYISMDKNRFERDFDNANKLVDKHGSKLSAHGNFPEEYVADLYAARKSNDNGAAFIKWLKSVGFQNRANCAKIKTKWNKAAIIKQGKLIKLMSKTPLKEYVKLFISLNTDLSDIYQNVKNQLHITKPGDTSYRELNEYARDSKISEAYSKAADTINEMKQTTESMYDNEHKSPEDVDAFIDTYIKEMLKQQKKFYHDIDAFARATDYEIKARIYFIRHHINDDSIVKEGATLTMEQINAFFQESENEYVTDNKNTEGKIGTPDNKTDNVNSESPSQTQKTHVNESITDTDTVNLPPTEDDKKVDSGNSMSTPPTPGTESFTQESTPLLRPKKLKAIPIREIVAYATSEMNAIKDANDQAMLSGYVAAKLELVDFYIVVLDTNDARYVVPHSRQYLVDGQKQLNDLLTKILKIRPIDRTKRLWAAIL